MMNLHGKSWASILALLIWIGAEGAGGAVPAPFEGYWNVPVPAQGAPPENWSVLEKSLKPSDCGGCHFQQFQDWKTSLHAKAMSPGVTGQLVDLLKSDPESAASCLTCHAPLTEQAPVVSMTDDAGNGTTAANPLLDKSLSGEGIVCAACHVRRHARYGPPPRDPQTLDKMAELPHGGFTPSDFFLSSEFCAACHQHPDDTAINGKPIENTVKEWERSDYPHQGKTCQTCHMPDRAHLWRGIHDKDMVASAITVSFSAKAGKDAKKTVAGSLKVTNSGAGHFFPTYVTPTVHVRVYQADSDGKPILGTMKEGIITRVVELTADESREISDTRIAPGKSFTLAYSKPLAKGAAAVVGEIEVSPDHYYIGLYEALLSDTGTSAEVRKFLEAAHDRAVSSSFIAWRQSLPLK